MMRYSYDVSTKDKEISYAILVDKYLIKLGFGLNKKGTKYLRDLILTIYFNKEYDFFVESKVDTFLTINNITTISRGAFLRAIKYSIQTVDYSSLKKNFYSIFRIELDYNYLTTKTLIILIINRLLKTDI